MSMVFNFNSVRVFPAAADGHGNGTDFGSGLFEIACRMSHSCSPNCCWISSQDGTKKLVRLIASVSEGEELTISYVDSLLLPTHVRRAELLQTKYFVCSCERCAKQEYDETRRFKCSLKRCPGVHFVIQTENEAEPKLSDCSKCGNVAEDSFVQNLLQQERGLKEEIDQIEFIADHGIQVDVTDRIRKLRPPHRFHHLAVPCYKIQGELYTQYRDYRNAARANEAVVACYDAIFREGVYDRNIAFACERLGDSLQNFNLAAAEKAFQRTVRILQVTDGVSQPYSKCAIGKLLSVQRRMLGHSVTIHDAERCALCGGASKLRCSRCRSVFYCQKQHQVIHWSELHKKQCRPKATSKK